MGGGGAGSHNTEYQNPRVGVHRRQYAQLSDNGFQSQAEYDAAVNKHQGLNYDSKFGTYTLKNGVDFDAAVGDWNNYQNELAEQKAYQAKEDRRLQEPTDFAGTRGGTTQDLAINKNSQVSGITKVRKSKTNSGPSLDSTQQPLGIY